MSHSRAVTTTEMALEAENARLRNALRGVMALALAAAMTPGACTPSFVGHLGKVAGSALEKQPGEG